TAEFEVAHGDAKAGAELVVLAHRGESLAGDFKQARVAVEEEIRVGLMLEPADASAELVKLRKTEAVGTFDDDRVAVGDIEAALDDRGADQHVIAAGHELGHFALKVAGVH